MILNDSRFLHVDFEALLKRLTNCALRWFEQESCFGKLSLLPATAQSAEDLAIDAIVEILKDDKTWRPKSEYEDPFPLLRKIMYRDFLDLIKSSKYKKTNVLDTISDGENTVGLDQIPSPTDGYASAEAAILAKKLEPYVKDEPELQDYIDVVLAFNIHKREDIAAILNISPEEVTKRQRRLETRLTPWYRAVSTKGYNYAK